MSPANRDPLRIEVVDGVTVVRFAETRLVAEEVIEPLGDRLYGLVTDEGVTKLLISFRDVRFLASAVIGKLMNLSRKMAKSGGKLRVSNLCPTIRDVFRVGQFDKVLDVYDDEQAALEDF